MRDSLQRIRETSDPTRHVHRILPFQVSQIFRFHVARLDLLETLRSLSISV